MHCPGNFAVKANLCLQIKNTSKNKKERNSNIAIRTQVRFNKLVYNETDQKWINLNKT